MLRSILFPLLFLIQITHADDPNNYFTSPSETNGIRPVWIIGDEKTISWRTTQEEFNVTFWQHDLEGVGAAKQNKTDVDSTQAKIQSTDQISNFTWVVQLYGFDLNHFNVFFFCISPSVPGSPIGFFNITKSTTTNIVTTSATISPTPTKALGSGPSSGVIDTVAQSPGSSSRDAVQQTTTGRIALGIGIGIGVPVLAALTALVWFKTRETRSTMAAGTVPASWPFMRQPQPPPKEMPGSDPTNNCAELPVQQC
ncbi:hypothetical protein BO78DRAFT_446357 [Aspergillus sclerotiicarbonarius CBS 121057]|uniref:Mid2 domain-containing protein n=1 Tax=Aspergillus sclerotiicarbonarius (strain CBS 121057 / IBT 28362) TaxID=1448318 RepID=A0A319EUL5_ASPSB|nr:hypothetical protein BO78DRAFT_446357 [Aspergillus sclerotiicarbonarius CBS 121057]